MNFVEETAQKPAGEKRFRVLYIDDDKDHVAEMQSLFTEDAIDDCCVQRNGDEFSPEEVALLKRVDLVGVENNPGRGYIYDGHGDVRYYPDKDALAKDQRRPGRVKGEDDAAYAKRLEEWEQNQTPMSKVIRQIYSRNDNEKYDVIITDMQMPAHDLQTEDAYRDGGKMIANAARIVGVPVLVHSKTKGDEIRSGIQGRLDRLRNKGFLGVAEKWDATEPDSGQERVAQLTAEAERRHAEFSASIQTPSKGIQFAIYRRLLATLEKLEKPPQSAAVC